MVERLTYASLMVMRSEAVTPHMRRVTFGGTDLEGFTWRCADQHVKLFFPKNGQPIAVPEMPEDGDVMSWYRRYLEVPEERRPWMRSYTIRRHLPGTHEVEIDFVLHGEDAAGPAAAWAAQATPGDEVGMYGPQVSNLHKAERREWALLVGDETALPAIAAQLEALAPGERAVAVIEVADEAEEQAIESAGEARIHWVYRAGSPAGESTVLLDAVRALSLPSGDVSAWLAGEAGAVRALRRHLVGERGISKRDIVFTGYWRVRLTQDDDPTTEDLADHTESPDFTDPRCTSQTSGRL